MPEYAADSPNYEAWFALEHEEQRRRGVQRHHANPVPPLVIKPEEEEAKAAYQEALAEAFTDSIELERWKAEAAAAAEEAAYEAEMAEAMDLSAAGDCVVPPSPPPLTLTASVSEPAERYVWTGQVQELVNTPPIWLGAMPEQEAMYLQHWRQRRLAEVHAHAEQLMQREREPEEEERARIAALPEPQPRHTPVDAALAAYQAAFGWTSPPPVFIDLIGDDDDGKGEGNADV